MATSAGTVERRSRARAALALLPIARAPQFLALVSAQTPAEVEHPVQDVVRLEVGLAAVEVHESSGSEAPFLIEHEPDAPAPARDGLAAAAALRLRARRSAALHAGGLERSRGTWSGRSRRFRRGGTPALQPSSIIYGTVLRIGRLRRDTWSVSHLTDCRARAATRGAGSWV